MNRAMSKLTKLVIVIAVSIAMALTPICAYAAPAQQTVTVDAVAVNNAIANKDYNYIISVFFKYYGNYFRQHYQDANFQYFNATEYLKKNPDVAAAFNNDPKLALEHYLAHGVYEGRSGCGKYDIVKFIKAYPETVLSPEFTSNVNTPDAYFTSIQTKVESANSSGTAQPVSGGGSGSGGGYTPSPSPSPTPTPTPTVNKKVTMMYYFVAASDLEGESGDMSMSLIDTLLGLYGADTTGINVIATLGGGTKWQAPYLNKTLVNEKGEAQTRYFAIDIDKAKAALDAIAKITKVPVSQMYEALHNTEEGGKAISDSVREHLLNEAITADTVKVIGTPASNDMADKETMKGMLNLATSTYKADDYALSLSGHGGGASGGVTINVDKLGAALKESGFNTDSTKLDLLVFDACIMGGVEVANYLKDYFTYMYGSETFQRGDVNYYALAKSLIDNKSNSDIAKALAYTVFTSRTAYLIPKGDLQTAAIFKSAEANNAITAINTWANILDSQIKAADTEELQNKIFAAMKKASIRAFQLGGWTTRDENYNCFDTEDYLEQLKKELNAIGVTGCNASIDAAIAAVDKFVDANSYNYNGVVIYNSTTGGLVESSKALWDEYLHYNFCGGSLFFPSYGYTSSLGVDNVAATLASRQKDLNEYYNNKYRGTGLGDYCGLITDYVAHYVSQKEVDRVKALSQELVNGAAGKATYSQLVDLTLTPDERAIKVTVGSGYTKENKPENSSGDMFLDLMDTAKEFVSYLTRKVSCICNEKNVTVDLIFSGTRISYMNVDGVHDAVNVITREVMQGTNIDYAYGTSSTATENDAADLLLRSYYDGDEQKRQLIAGINSEYAAKVKDADDKWKILESLKETDPGYAKAKQDYDDAIKARDEFLNLNDYKIYAGKCSIEGEEDSKEVQLVFKKVGDNYEYANSVVLKEVGEEGAKTMTYTVADKVKDITFYHYFMTDADGGGSLVYTLENYGYTYQENSDLLNYYDPAKYTYSVTGEQTVYVKSKELWYVDSDEKHNGYYVTIETLDYKVVDLGVDADGTHKPESGDTYSGLITLKDIGEKGYVAPVTPPSPAPKPEEIKNSSETAETVITAGTETIESDETVRSEQTEEQTTEPVETISGETQIIAEPEIIPVQALIEEKVTTDESAETSDEAA